MSVPVYGLITAAETAPGKPITSSVGRRLWRNPLAILGIDENEANPVFSLPPSRIKTIIDKQQWIAGADGGNTLSVVLSERSAGAERIEYNEIGAGVFSIGFLFYIYDVIYSGGVPTHVLAKIGSGTVPGQAFNNDVFAATNHAINNSWINLFTDDWKHVLYRFRADANSVLLDIDCAGPPGSEILMNMHREKFTPK